MSEPMLGVQMFTLRKYTQTLEDLREARVTPVALHRIVGGVAGAGEHLERVARHPLRHLGGVVLHHRRLLRTGDACVDLGAHRVQELSRRFRLHLFSPQHPARSAIRRHMTLGQRRSSRVRPPVELDAIRATGNSAHLFELQGELRFSAVEVLQRRVYSHMPELKQFVLDFSRVDSVDPAALDGLQALSSNMTTAGRRVVFAAIPGSTADVTVKSASTSNAAKISSPVVVPEMAKAKLCVPTSKMDAACMTTIVDSPMTKQRPPLSLRRNRSRRRSRVP